MDKEKNDMTVREAGEKGGQRVSELVNEGKQQEWGSQNDDRDEP